jgi:uncharacterized phage protein (TIGR02216 family)
MRFEWPNLLRLGLGRLGLRPAEFWALTPMELQLMLGLDLSNGAMTRDRLEALAAKYPDAAKQKE